MSKPSKQTEGCSANNCLKGKYLACKVMQLLTRRPQSGSHSRIRTEGEIEERGYPKQGFILAGFQ